MTKEQDMPSVVLFLSDLPPLHEIVGGGEVRPHELVQSLQRAGIHTRVWCARPRATRYATTPTLRVRTLPPRSRALREAALPVVAVAVFLAAVFHDRRVGRQPILWLRAPGNVSWKGALPILGEPGMFCVPFARLLRVPIWASNHDISPDHELDKIRQRNLAGIFNTAEEKRHRRSGKANARLQRFAFRRASIVTAVSDGTQRELVRRYGLPLERTPIIRAGVNIEMFDTKTWTPPRKTWRVGYIGSFADADTQMLLETMRVLSNDHRFSFVIGGQGFNALSPVQLPPPERVKYWRDTRYARLNEFAKDVDIWLVPLGDFEYQQWAWPLKIPMYMATGRPLVITEHPDLDSAGVREHLFVATELTADSIVRTVQAIVDDPDASATRAAGARRYAIDEFNWDRQFAKGLNALHAQ